MFPIFVIRSFAVSTIRKWAQGNVWIELDWIVCSACSLSPFCVTLWLRPCECVCVCVFKRERMCAVSGSVFSCRNIRSTLWPVF